MRREQRCHLGTNSITGGNQLLPFGHIATTTTNEFTSGHVCVQDNRLAIESHIFLHDNGVRPRRERRASQDSNRFAGTDGQMAINARGLLADHRKRAPVAQEAATTA